MNCQLVTWAIDLYGVSASARWLLVFLARHSKNSIFDGTVLHIAHGLGVSDRSVQRATIELVKLGLVVREEHSGGKNRYHIVTRTTDKQTGGEAVIGDKLTEGDPQIVTPTPVSLTGKNRGIPTRARAVESQPSFLPTHLPDSLPKEPPKGSVVSLRESTGPQSAVHGEVDIRKQLWDEGRQIIRRLTGQVNGQAGKLLGKLVRDANGDCSIVLSILRNADEDRPAEPVAWITKSVANRTVQQKQEQRLQW